MEPSKYLNFILGDRSKLSLRFHNISRLFGVQSTNVFVNVCAQIWFGTVNHKHVVKVERTQGESMIDWFLSRAKMLGRSVQDCQPKEEGQD